MTEGVFADKMAKPGEEAFDEQAPENVSPLLVWLGSAEGRDITGRIFEVSGGRLCVSDGYRDDAEVDKGGRWDPAEIGSALHDLLGKAPAPQKVYGT